MNAPRLGVLVPCRNEADVIERRLANLAQDSWPPGEHRVVVVDDGSTDDTARRAASALVALEARGVRADCVTNTRHPGKAGAIQAGLDRLGDEVDVVVLTDADVVHAPGSLRAIADAFAREAELGMACGAQCFTAALPSSGAAPDDAPPGRAAAPWDRATAAVRRYESRRGRLFSVHGQLLAWRADLGLRPRAELAADDLDLVLAVRRLRPRRTTRLIAGATFFESKPAGDAASRSQALRRARAYLQVLAATEPEPGLQGFCYRELPLRAPRIAALLALALLVALGFAFGPLGALLGVLALAIGCATRAGRHVLDLLLVIERARRAQRTEPLDARWEMPR